jgi:aspartyl-tRNA(Asn)/glutamyl-tRNA(Gln) amidotransferase subunit A
VPFAIGSETSGSIVTPAAYCGVTGLRPTYGVVSRAGAMPLAWTLDKLGPMARSAEDCWLVFQAIRGVDRADPTTRPFRPPPRPRRRLRIGYAPADFCELAHDPARDAFAEALRAFGSLGGEMVEASLPPDLPYGAMVGTIVNAEAASLHGELIRSHRLEELVDEAQRVGLRFALETPAWAYLDASRARGLVQEAFTTIFRDVDLILSVGRSRSATGIDEPTRPLGTLTATAPPDAPPSFGSLIAAGNLAGLPAIAFPCGFDATGLPVGLQLVGPACSEELLVHVASDFQAATDWHTRRPPL